MGTFGESWSRTLWFHHHPEEDIVEESISSEKVNCTELPTPPNFSLISSPTPQIFISLSPTRVHQFPSQLPPNFLLPRSKICQQAATTFSAASSSSSRGRNRRQCHGLETTGPSPITSSSSSPNLSKFYPKINFYTLILLSSALVIFTLSPSASANRCTPTFTLLSNGEEAIEWMEDSSPSSSTPLDSAHSQLPYNSSSKPLRTAVLVREGSSYKLNCSLNRYHSVKWMISGREVTPQLAQSWDIDIEKGEEMEGYIYTELRVNNASQQHHNGEYKCTPQCMSDPPAANQGVMVSINIAINVTIAGSELRRDQMDITYRQFVAREKQIELVCKAAVPNAQMTWYRIKDDKRTEEPMEEICGVEDVELKWRQPHPPKHCTVSASSSSGGEESSITLKFIRTRKDGNETLKTISDYRRYVCRAVKNGQDGQALLELAETVSAERKFLKGERSVIVVEGNVLPIYCDVHGIPKKEFENGKASLQWKKDGMSLSQDDIKKTKKISEHMLLERGKPYRVGFSYEMAEPEHRGRYTCEVIRSASAIDSEFNNSTLVIFSYYVRVKDKLGALWPFLGICGEVVILFTIILIYEKRHNKTELDESDTDGSPDQ